MPVRKIAITLADQAMREVSARGGDTDGQRSRVISDMLERYGLLMAQIRTALRPHFGDKELGLLADALNGHRRYEARTIRLMALEISDAIKQDRLDGKWGVDGPALLEKLNALDTPSLFALVDGVEIWWERVGRGEQPPHAEVLK